MEGVGGEDRDEDHEALKKEEDWIKSGNKALPLSPLTPYSE
jgi:hypothetical protein